MRRKGYSKRKREGEKEIDEDRDKTEGDNINMKRNIDREGRESARESEIDR